MNAKPGTNRPNWELESTDPELSEKLKAGLSEVVDPEIGLNIIQLGLIRNVKVAEDSAIVRMILTTPFCPYGPAMLEETRQKAENVLARPTAIDLGMDMWDFSMMDEDSAPDWLMY